ncbi:hypothetical protein KC19_2G136300 [Ceratodon purpureus]|uniref:AIG1-type G domain-containing protein n=1 Tax=Ceratodon purpureus TaxID=3225 RepID=A0A8T0IWK4_CERPU|nr:hypothetical protein KC19_2G136300 [Ceratodon purpureus]KAG0587041.1 hypothetical protein KC19_2G136300 [Ceratodon purpureus]
MILVIGNGPSESSTDGTYWGSVAAALQERGHDVKLTTDLVELKSDRPLETARRWISRNSLRRMAGQGVKIICAMGTEGQNDLFWWSSVMKLVFEGGYRAVAAVLQVESLRSCDFFRHVVVVRETKEDASAPYLDLLINDRLEPFTIPFSQQDKAMRKLTHAWSSEKVILFGRTGSGKSTTAQMLTKGHLDPDATIFKADSSARGVTSEIERADGRGWHVTDTPGFGETKSGTVSSKQATDIITKFIGNIGGNYSHYVYVVKKDRVDTFDERLWKFYKKVFVGAETNFSVVVTGCEQPLSTEDEDHLKKAFAGCNTITGVNFPPTNTDDAELEEDHKEERAESLVELEDAFARLGVSERSCDEGLYSKETLKIEKSCGRSLFGTVGGDLIHYLIARPIAAVGRSLHKSEIDEEFILLPQ